MEPPMAFPHPRGGMYFEDFAITELFEHRLRRIVTQAGDGLARVLSPPRATAASCRRGRLRTGIQYD
jgi:hypothetical protein